VPGGGWGSPSLQLEAKGFGVVLLGRKGRGDGRGILPRLSTYIKGSPPRVILSDVAGVTGMCRKWTWGAPFICQAVRGLYRKLRQDFRKISQQLYMTGRGGGSVLTEAHRRTLLLMPWHRCHGNVAGMKLGRTIYDEGWDLFGYTGYSPEMDAIIVAFKGTDSHSIYNWAENMHYWKTEYQVPYPGSEGASVHTGGRLATTFSGCEGFLKSKTGILPSFLP